MQKSYSMPIGLDFQKRYATTVLELERLNKDLNKVLHQVQQFCCEVRGTLMCLDTRPVWKLSPGFSSVSLGFLSLFVWVSLSLFCLSPFLLFHRFPSHNSSLGTALCLLIVCVSMCPAGSRPGHGTR